MGLHRINDVEWLQDQLENILQVVDEDVIDVNLTYRCIAELICEYRQAKKEYAAQEYKPIRDFFIQRD